MADKVNHHYVPQFYLRGFADGEGRQARVFVFDSDTGRAFPTHVRNIASRRNFNKIEIDGLDPNHVEDALSIVEAEISAHLSETINAVTFLSDQHFSSIMLLMAMLSVRNPRFRGVMENFHRELAEKVLDITHSSEERWKGQIDHMQKAGVPLDGEVTYEQAKAFYDAKNYTISVDQTHLIELEFTAVDTVIELLAKRNWCFIKPPPECEYITCDDPVVLSWKSGELTPYSPGHGLPGTIVLFAMSPNLLLVGTFERLPYYFVHSPDQVTATNTSIARHSSKQIYARSGDFRLHLENTSDVLGRDLPRFFGRR